MLAGLPLSLSLSLSLASFALSFTSDPYPSILAAVYFPIDLTEIADYICDEGSFHFDGLTFFHNKTKAKWTLLPFFFIIDSN